jgi:ribonuclease HIII
MGPKTSFTFALDPTQQQELITLLQTGNYRPCVVPHARIAADTEGCRIALFKTGKCLVQGKQAADFVAFILEPNILKAARIGYEDLLNPEGVAPHMGVDESGKGDFFGPLVTACAYVDAGLVPALRDIGVRDSKLFSSDKKLLEVAREAQCRLGSRYTVVLIGPAKYNSLYTRMRSVNSMLAWAHARAIENMLAQVPDCPRAISDQFGNKSLVVRALMQQGRKIELVQRPRAESDVAVAAASILARAGFLLALKKMGSEYGRPFPKGASPAVQEAAVKLVKARGPEVLLATAKTHFRTTDVILQQCGLTRAALGPAGAAISKPLQDKPFWKRKTKSEHATEEPA